MPTYTATDFEPVPPGLYTARLENIEEATSAHGTYYRWQFVIEDEGGQADRRQLRTEWAEYHQGQAERHRAVLKGLVVHHEEQAAKLMEATHERSLG
jgi:hypothetical protein